MRPVYHSPDTILSRLLGPSVSQPFIAVIAQQYNPQMNPRLDLLHPYAFERLRALLAEVKPPA